jgi:hypothetical protein
MIRCADCGFLGLRRRQDRAVLEAENEFRIWAMHPVRVEGNSGNVYESRPICCAQASYLAGELNGETTEELKRVIQHERDCKKFTPWKQGFTPKEHHEMIDRQWEQERQDRRDREMMEFQAEQATLAHKRHMQSLAVALLAAILGGIATLAAVRLSPSPTVIVNPPPVPTESETN